jgi:hypothetical protein
MIRITLMAAAVLAAIATAGSAAFAQSGAPVRTLGPPATERKAVPCADKSCASKPIKRAYVGPAPLGW